MATVLGGSAIACGLFFLYAGQVGEYAKDRQTGHERRAPGAVSGEQKVYSCHAVNMRIVRQASGQVPEVPASNVSNG